MLTSTASFVGIFTIAMNSDGVQPTNELISFVQCRGGKVWYRTGLSPALPTGTAWLRLQTRGDWRTLSVQGSTLWGLTTGGSLMAREGACLANLQGEILSMLSVLM